MLSFRQQIVDTYHFGQYYAHENGWYSGHWSAITAARNSHLDKLANSGRIAKIVYTYENSTSDKFLEITKSTAAPPCYAVSGLTGDDAVITVYADTESKTRWMNFLASIDQ